MRTMNMYEPQRQETYLQTFRSAKIQIRLHICAVWSESSLGEFWIAKDAMLFHAGNEDSDQTARMRRRIWVFVERTYPMVRFL